MNKQKTLVETPSHTDTSIITASDAALRYIAATHGAEVPLEPFSAAVTAQALASALQHQAEPAAAAVGKLRMLLAACNRIEEEAEEFEGPDGLEMGITTDHWHEFAEALTAARKALATSRQAAAPSAALADIAAERRRQIEQEGWTPEHDDKYRPYVLSGAAGCYAMHTLAYPAGDPPSAWPFAASWWKPSADTRRNLVKAGALIAAEIERIDRAAQKGGEA